MTNAQDLKDNAPTQAIEIDAHIFDLQLTLSMSLPWVSHGYGRAYRHVKQRENLIYLPEVYVGVQNNQPNYVTVTPDNDKSGSFFFVVGPEIIDTSATGGKFQRNTQNYIYHEVGIVFWVNLNLIDKPLLQNELSTTQHLIHDVRGILTNQLNGKPYRFEVHKIVREFDEIYKEFTLKEDNQYLMAPYQAFRVNGRIRYQEGCLSSPYGNITCDTINSKLTLDDKLNCILPTLDFSNNDIFNALSAQQKIDLQTQLM